ncbi:MAG: hypothetical protein ABI981_09300 [Betaproteobacteria bacterium]
MSYRIAMALATVSIAVLALLRIADTYSVFNHTYDEAFHIAAGMQWLDQGRYDAEPFHPPMRSVYAVGPRLLGSHSFGEPSLRREGQRILYEGGDYKRVLTAARIAALPFFLLALAVVGVWAARISGPSAALAAMLAYSMLPLALANAGWLLPTR